MLSFLDRVKVKFRHWIMPQEALIQLAAPYPCVLDIGCGLGIFLVELSGTGKILKGFEISLDVVKKAKIVLAKKKIKDVKISHFNGDPLTLGGWDQYDIIYLNDVLHHIPPDNQAEFLKKIYTKMRKGARFVLKDIDASSPLVVFNKLHDLLLNRQYPHEQSMAQCRSWCQDMGFQIEEVVLIRKLVYPHFILVMTKV
ncbi:MAG: class I SAM-dependent methyltransferase [Alphaproteobacteria bacterium]|jgi:SAM-dependent methyltransferase|nr:class I SAM-dependent methyltransferase [Alphaproteobacteria bacterium]